MNLILLIFIIILTVYLIYKLTFLFTLIGIFVVGYIIYEILKNNLDEETLKKIENKLFKKND